MTVREIFCDLDGVLCDFIPHMEATFGKPWEPELDAWCNHNDRAKQNHFWIEAQRLNPAFWETMPWMSDGRQLWAGIVDYDPQILTACPDVWQSAAYDKKIWCINNLGPDVHVNTVARAEKKLYATFDGVPNILIDDYDKNINEWWEAGGFGILHVSAENTLKQLNAVLSKSFMNR